MRGEAETAASDRVSDQIASEARVVGLRGFSTPSLEAVEHRRIQLWLLSTVLLVSISIAAALLSLWPAADDSPIPPAALRWGIVLLAIAFCAYAIEKERHLQRLARLLTDERVLTAALSNRLHELSLLLKAGTAMNAVLELDSVLDVILRSAIELLSGKSGSVMLLEDTELVAACVQGNPDAIGRRVPIGHALAGRVALTQEPLLVNGRPSTEDFPGLREHTQSVDSAMSVPLVNRGTLLGVLNVNADDDHTFTEYDLRALSLFAEQAAAAIANARLYDAERTHVEELLELDRMKSEFLDLVTHELRTPLTVILAAAQTGLRPGGLMPTQEILEIVQTNGKRLAAMVEDLLMTVRLEHGRPALDPVEVDLAELLREVERDFRVTDRPIELEIRDEVHLFADIEALRRIVVNLADNAHKYGAPPVRVRLERSEGMAVLSVLDAGPGLPEDRREQVFERFHRVEGSGKPGLGLGLSIVRGLAEALGGHATSGDAPGGGAAFRVELPLTPARVETV